MAGEKVLIIDPSQDDLRPLIEELLYPEGYSVVHSLDGEDGLRQAQVGNPDLIIVEYSTQQQSGLSVLTQLLQAKQEIPLILTGVTGSAEIYKWALQVGVVDYLLKPFDLEEAHSAIKRALSRKTPLPPSQGTGLLARGHEQINLQLEKRVRELNILHDLGRAVTSVRDLEKLLNRIVEAAVYLARAEEGFLLLLDEETNELYLRAGQGLGKKFATGFSVKSTDSLVWQVVQTGESVIITSDPDQEQLKIKTGYLVQALLHVPLKLHGEVIGVLSVDNMVAGRSFGEDDLNLLTVLADYAAIAIDNVQQYKRAEAESAKLAELLSAQTPVDDEPQVESMPLEWLVQELKAQQEIAGEGRKEAEKLAREMAAHVSAVEQLAEGWRNQQAEAEELAQRLSGAEAATVMVGSGASAAALTDLQETLDNLGAGLLVTDREGIVALANGAAARLLDSDQLVGRDLRLVSPSTHWTKRVDQLRSSEEHRGTMWQDATFWSKGRLIKAVFLPLSKSETKRWAVILRDLLRARAVQLVFEDLITPVSQEFRTPMTILSSYTDLLLDETVGLLVPAQQRLLERMRANLARMKGVLDRPIVVDESPEEALTADLNAILQEALADADPWIEERDLTVDLNLDEDLPQVAAQPDCVYQMAVNLLQNAVLATPAGGTIEIHAQADISDGQVDQPSHVAVSVHDQGGGIASEFLGHLFEPYYSAEDEPIPGLGSKGGELSTTKTLVEVFGGRVWAETELGVGSTFSFVLPVVGG